MNTMTRTGLTALIPLTATAAAVLPVTASASASPAGPHPAAVAGVQAKVASQRATLAYWTPARLRAAKPVTVTDAGTRAHTGAALGRPAGPAGKVPGSHPSGSAADTGTPQGTSISQFSYPFPYDNFAVPTADTKLYPWDVNGALFFTNGGSNYVCSATAIPSASGVKNENEIWTAGQCLVNTLKANKALDSNAVFIPAYNAAGPVQDPFGKFAWNGGWSTTTAWLNSRDLTTDEAAMTVGTSSLTGHTLGQTVGWDGFAWNQSVNQQFSVIGDVGKMNQDLAATAAQLSGDSANSVGPIGVGGPTIVGAGWNIGWTLTATGFVNGQTAISVSGQPAALYSSYLNTVSNRVRCFGAASC